MGQHVSCSPPYGAADEMAWHRPNCAPAREQATCPQHFEDARAAEGDLRALGRLISTATTAHHRALEANRDFLSECAALRASLEGLEEHVSRDMDRHAAAEWDGLECQLDGRVADWRGAECRELGGFEAKRRRHENQVCAATNASGLGAFDPHRQHDVAALATSSTTAAQSCGGPEAASGASGPAPASDDRDLAAADARLAEGGRPKPPALASSPSSVSFANGPAPRNRNDAPSGDLSDLCCSTGLRCSLGNLGTESSGFGNSYNVLWAEWSPDTPVTPECFRTPTAKKTLTLEAPDIKHRTDEENERQASRLQRLVVRPNSITRTSWDVLSLFILSYDCLMIPLSVFGVGVGGHFRYLELSVTVFWTVDIYMSFMSGFYTLGGIELRPSVIAFRYLRGTFLFDVTIVCVDLLLNLSQILEGEAIRLTRMGKFIRFGKVFRLLRLLRILKMPKALEGITETIQSKTLSTVVGIVKAIALIATVNHFLACMFFFLSNSIREDLGWPSWVDPLYWEDRDKVYFYFTALHWSVTQFTPASMEVQPRNSPERLFAILVIFAALMVFSTFVSGITSAMTSLREYNKYKYVQLDNLRRYILDKRISVDLAQRINQFINGYKFLGRRKVREADVHALAVLPTPMKLRLRYEAHAPFLIHNPFLFQVSVHDAQVLSAICFFSVKELHMNLAQDAFQPRRDASDMYFLLDGHVDFYTPSGEVQAFHSKNACYIFSEASLWLRFQHSSRLYCRTASDFLTLSSNAFRERARDCPTFYQACRIYAISLVQKIDFATHLLDGAQKFDHEQELAQQAFEAAYQDAESEGREDSSDNRKALSRTSRTQSMSRQQLPEEDHVKLDEIRLDDLSVSGSSSHSGEM